MFHDDFDFTARILAKRAAYETALAARGIKPSASKAKNEQAAAIEYARMIAISKRF